MYEMQARYQDMVDKLKPLAWASLSNNQRETVSSCLRAGEPYEAMLDLTWAAGEAGADMSIISEAFNLMDDEDKEDFIKYMTEWERKQHPKGNA